MEGGAGVEWELVNSLLYCSFVSVRKRDPSAKYEQKSRAWFDNLERILKRTGNGNWRLYEVYLSIVFFFVACLKWLLEMLARIKFSCVALKFMALYSFWLDSCFSDMGNIT